MSLNFSRILAAILTASLSALSAHAATLYLNNVSPSASETITCPGLSAETTPYVGQINWTFDRSNPGNAFLDALVPGNTLSTFCIEGTQNVYLNQNANFASITNIISQTPQDNVGSLYVMGTTKAANINKFYDAYIGQASLNNVNGAAFQMGIWELLYDASPDFSSGNFKAQSTNDLTSQQALAQAQLWLGNYSSQSPNTHYELYALTDPNLQDQLFGIPTFGQNEPPPPSTPLPAALPAGLGLMGALAAVRKFHRR